jgi:hypothetical protein
MNDFKQEWDLPMALEVLGSPNVDSATWSEAVKWLLFYGPPELREMINQASGVATSEHFPELMPAGYDEDGAPCYDMQELAATLGLAEQELASRMVEWEEEAGEPRVVKPPRVHRIH